jgi:hypothetical protein
VYVAQTRLDAAARVIDAGDRLVQAGAEDVRVYRGIGNEHLRFENGSRIDVIAPNEHGAHGYSIDLVILDEAWTVQPSVLQGLVPARAARPNSQMWVISTMGTEDSEVLNDLVAKGRDKTPGLAFFEWSADEAGGDDVFNPEHWGRWMPALGNTVDTSSVEAALTILSPSEFKRAFGNVLTAVDEELFPVEWWEETSDPYQQHGGEVVLAYDVNYNPDGATVAAAFPTERGWHVDIVAYEPGESVLWILPELKRLAGSMKVQAVATAGGGPARSIHPEVEGWCDSRLIPFRSMSVQDMGAAAGLFYDGLRTRTLTHGQSEQLDVAVSRARSKNSGDLWRFDKKLTRVDVSPLVASSVALFAAQEVKAQERKPGLFFG